MTVKVMEQSEKPAPESSAPKAEALGPQKEIKRLVLEKLGKSPDFSSMRVINLWADRFRVNLFYKLPVKGDFIFSDTEMRESFFIIYDADKNQIHRSSPEINRKYE